MALEIQNHYQPDCVSPPGETLAELLEMHNMTQADLAERTGLHRKTINEIVKGLSPISQETAIAFERVFRVPASFWNNREQNYRECLARRDAREHLKDEVAWLRKIPVAAMLRLEYSIRKYSDKVRQLEEALAFFGVASPKELGAQLRKLQPAFRRSTAFRGDPISTAAWLRQGELQAREIECADYDPGKFRQVLVHLRTLTRSPLQEFWPEMVGRCADAGVAVVLVKPLPRTHVSGATRWLSPARALIALSLRYRTDDQFWFSFFHEAGHVLKHGKRQFFVDSFSDEEDADAMEHEANEFARDFLIPASEWRRFARLPNCRSRAVISESAACMGIAPGIVVGRAQHDGVMPKTHNNDLKRKLEWPG